MTPPRQAWPWWRRRPDDQGAVATLVAILLGTGVLLGALALAVDVGRIYMERGDLQNGADAAALALARACAADAGDCDTLDELRQLASRYADDNAADGASHVETICGSMPGVLPICAPQAPDANLAGCLGTPPASHYVEVRLSTELADGSTVLPAQFSQSFAGATVGACARAAWGELSVLALTINDCVYADAPHRPAGAELRQPDQYVVEFWTWFDPPESDDLPPCVAAGEDPGVPNIAGLLDGADANCQIAMSRDGYVTGSFFNFIPERTASRACVDRVRRAYLNREVIYLPVHDARTAGSSPSFHHVQVAPFVVTGFQLGAPDCGGECRDPETGQVYSPDDYRERSWLTGTHPCDIRYHRCIAGVFVGDPIDVADLTGAAQIRLIG